MEIINAATNWAKAEMTSAIFFMLFGIAYLLAAIGFWQWGTTQLMKALIIPILIAGGLLLSAGISFYLSNKSLVANYESEYKANPSVLIKSEMERTQKTMATYENVALKIFPIILVIAGLVAIFISHPWVRAIGIAIVAFLFVLILLDSQALKRIKTYYQQLELVEKDLKE